MSARTDPTNPAEPSGGPARRAAGRRRTLLVGAAVAAGSLTLGLAAPALAQEAPTTEAPESASETEGARPDPGAALRVVFDALVSEGVITQEQADAIQARLAEAIANRPDRPHRQHQLLRGAVQTAAEAIGIEPSDLASQLRDGATVAEVATAAGVDPATVVDALVAAGTEHIQAALDAGRITEERAASLTEALPERAERFVNETGPR
jgi:hypothetical protein